MTSIRSPSAGSASGFSIFSPKGITWVNEKVGDAQFVSVISSVKCDESAWCQSEIFDDISSRRLHRQLPPKEETRALLKQFFEDFNQTSQLFHEATFMALFESRFTQEYNEIHGPGWWASLNMVLATTHRLRILGNLTLQDEEEISWLYFKNAMAVLTDLMLRIPHILSVQALLAMVSLCIAFRFGCLSDMQGTLLTRSTQRGTFLLPGFYCRSTCTEHGYASRVFGR